MNEHGPRHTTANPDCSKADFRDTVQIESRNALRQYDVAMKLVADAIASSDKFFLTPDHVCILNKLAIEDLEPSPGVFRTKPVGIMGTQHKPPPHEEVIKHVDDMCDYVNGNWDMPPIHLTSYLMWRLNWIHPFMEGNGRTTRMISYATLCIQLGCILPGTKTIPVQIAADRAPYFEALDEADAEWKQGRLTLTKMEALVSRLLAVQLCNLHDQATNEDTPN